MVRPLPPSGDREVAGDEVVKELLPSSSISDDPSLVIPVGS